MKKIILLSLATLLSGCVTPVTQMMNNKFSDIEPTKPEATGIWTTSVGPGLSTIKLNEDGNGILCEDTSGHLNLNKLKYSNGQLFSQNGMILKVVSIDQDILRVKTTLSAFNVDMVYKRDTDLKAASLKCAKEL
ncbi:J517_1871 family lipoprotein [Acinetobacter soli]|uniref:J517_1871 family lipoprotein n=1 Tax=Acinetobacter soli TaxID=487316 RepID=UPI001250A408|nr:J517_1871 family lipoprotein [Acinetobacter soli]